MQAAAWCQALLYHMSTLRIINQGKYLISDIVEQRGKIQHPVTERGEVWVIISRFSPLTALKLSTTFLIFSFSRSFFPQSFSVCQHKNLVL